MTFDRIAADTAVMAGVPCIRGTRIPVATIVGMVAEGMTTTEILADFPQLSEQDVREALWFAAAAVDQATLPPARVRLLIDESLEQELAEVLSGRGHDAAHVADLGLQGAPDLEVLTKARADPRSAVDGHMSGVGPE